MNNEMLDSLKCLKIIDLNMSILSDYTIIIYKKEFLVDIVVQYLKLRHFFLNKYKIYLIVFVTQIIMEKNNNYSFEY